MFSDFNYGCLPQKLVTNILAEAKNSGVMMAADSQSSSQVGDIARFQCMDLITPTEREARISTKSHEDGLVVLSEKLRKIAAAKHVILKMGGDGLSSNTEVTIPGPIQIRCPRLTPHQWIPQALGTHYSSLPLCQWH